MIVGPGPPDKGGPSGSIKEGRGDPSSLIFIIIKSFCQRSPRSGPEVQACRGPGWTIAYFFYRFATFFLAIPVKLW